MAGRRIDGARRRARHAGPAARQIPEVTTIEGDAARLDGLARHDLILSSMMLHWLDDPRAALVAWRRHLAPGGLLCVATPVAGSLHEWRDLLRASGSTTACGRFRQRISPTASAQGSRSWIFPPSIPTPGLFFAA